MFWSIMTVRQSPYAMDDHPIYYDLGTITLPLSTDCTFEDHADLEKRLGEGIQVT